MPKYAIGIDFGSLSARALIADVANGEELASVACNYPHAVMSERLPNGRPLPPDWALQHPSDYLECMSAAVRETVKKAGVDGRDVIGIGIDCTCNTFLPVDADNEPLCLKPEFEDNPHAWVKMWKHHSAQRYARRMEKIAIERGEKWLKRYGGKVSPEWMMPKLWETYDCAPEVYNAAASFIEAGDWVVSQLTGCVRRSSAVAGIKEFWVKGEGYLPKEYLRALDPGLERCMDEKWAGELYPVGTCAGLLREKGAALLGLPEGIPVAVDHTDAHCALPSAGLVRPGGLLMILGTSACHIMLGDGMRDVPGICGTVEDGVIPGYISYEAGQNCCGDHFQWLTEQCVPASYEREAQQRGINIQQLLTEKAQALKPGQSGLLALDWWNGNRSVLVDADLTGMMLGMTLQTKPEEIYRALIEAVAFGTRVIIENFEAHGVPISGLYACGGIAKKNALFMQIFADVLKREIRVARSNQNPALGSALFGTVAAGRARGGYDTIQEAAEAMGGTDELSYKPVAEHSEVYDALFGEYMTLHDYFGRGGNDVMKRLKGIRAKQSE